MIENQFITWVHSGFKEVYENIDVNIAACTNNDIADVTSIHIYVSVVTNYSHFDYITFAFTVSQFNGDVVFDTFLIYKLFGELVLSTFSLSLIS